MDVNILLASPATLELTPYALALTSQELREAANNLVTTRFPVTNFLLHAMSIEIGLKAAILNRDCSLPAKKRNRKEIGHDLLKAHNLYQEVGCGTLFDVSDIAALEKLNKYFVDKNLEYFKGEMILAACTGFGEFPTLDAIRLCNAKVGDMLRAANNFG